jgi:hypothetical protein
MSRLTLVQEVAARISQALAGVIWGSLTSLFTLLHPCCHLDLSTLTSQTIEFSVGVSVPSSAGVTCWIHHSVRRDIAHAF